jgi:erythromycin esterase
MKSQINSCFVIATMFFLCFTLTLRSQDKQSVLVKGVPVSTLFTTGETHRYTVSIDANQYAFFNLIQDGIDAMITMYDPDGKKLGQFDSPNFRNGDEPITLITDKKGNYVLEVTSIDEKGHQGK